MRWFEKLFGFAELDWESTQQSFEVAGEELRSRVNGRSFSHGRFTTPSLLELREQTRGVGAGELRLRHEAIGDVLELHALAENEGALFQAASQFNCLEFAGPDELPEDGVTQYDDDPTQGPACALAVAASTVYRNYFAPVSGALGQRRDRQIENLADVQALLDPRRELLSVRNGYTFSDAAKLKALGREIAHRDRDELLCALRIGWVSRADVTFARRFDEPERPQKVSQAFCSAISCGYAGGEKRLWEPLARLVLDAAYEATLRAAVLDKATRGGSGKVWLTMVGGGVFANERAWIGSAIRRAAKLMERHDLDVRVAHYRALDDDLASLIGGRG